METIQQIAFQIKRILDVPIFPLGNIQFTLWMLIYIIILSVLLFSLSNKLKKWIVEKALAKSRIEVGLREAIGTIIRYIVLLVGVLIIFQSAGINLSTLTVLVGALGLGIGFGLQTIASNFFSGLIILFERPIKVGDRLQIDDIAGDVKDISIRATTIITRDNIAIIVPNAEFISSKVINWSLTDRDVRLQVPVGVAYGSNPEEVHKVLLEVAEEHAGVLTRPGPDVLFQEFGDSSLNFVLRVWTREYITSPEILRSELNFAISKKFKEHEIQIPFPQRDIHIRSGNFR